PTSSAFTKSVPSKLTLSAGIEVYAKEENTENTISDETLPESSSSASSSNVGSVSTVPGSLAISSKTTLKPSKHTSAPSKAGQGTNKVVSATSNSTIPNNKPTSSAFTKSVLSKVDSSEDDELALGAEENHHKVYGTKRIAATSSMKVVSQVPMKKRKLISSTTARIDM
ncbi:hypothetical protein BDR03DRAFT_1018603, partial [Suillus americanus]